MRKVFFNEIDFQKGEVRLIQLNPVFVVGIRSKFIRVDPKPSGLHSMDCTVLEYNGREILVVESLLDVIQTIAFENAANFWHDNAKYILPQKLRRLSEKLQIIQGAEPEVVPREDSSYQCESKGMEADHQTE